MIIDSDPTNVLDKIVLPFLLPKSESALSWSLANVQFAHACNKCGVDFYIFQDRKLVRLPVSLKSLNPLLHQFTSVPIHMIKLTHYAREIILEHLIEVNEELGLESIAD